MKILVVDDSALMRRALIKILESEPEFEVVGYARDGVDGLEKVRKLRPDLVTLDIEMPEMDGLTALREIVRMPDAPAVLMCSTLTVQGSVEAIRAMRIGASDFLAKDPQQLSADDPAAHKMLIEKIRAIGATRRDNRGRLQSAERGPAIVDRVPALTSTAFDAICIGSSTGGPPVLETVLKGLPADLSIPVVVAQHMPAPFTRSLSDRQNEVCAVRVVHADRPMPLVPGVVHIVQGGRHGKLRRLVGGKLGLDITEDPADALYKPSVDVLFDSAARFAPGRTLGIVLTGMGEDGAKGAAPLHAGGSVIVTQHRETCVVYGMPRAVDAAGLSHHSLTPAGIAAMLGRLGGAAAARASA